MSQNPPIGSINEIARELVRGLGGNRAAERFDEALEEYGIERAAQEALVGIGSGLVYQAALRQQQRREPSAPPAPDPDAPRVEGTELPEDDPREGTMLVIDEPHDALEAYLESDDRTDGLYLRTPRGTFRVRLPLAVDSLEWYSEAGAGVSKIAAVQDVVDVDGRAE